MRRFSSIGRERDSESSCRASESHKVAAGEHEGAECVGSGTTGSPSGSGSGTSSMNWKMCRSDIGQRPLKKSTSAPRGSLCAILLLSPAPALSCTFSSSSSSIRPIAGTAGGCRRGSARTGAEPATEGTKERPMREHANALGGPKNDFPCPCACSPSSLDLRFASTRSRGHEWQLPSKHLQLASNGSISASSLVFTRKFSTRSASVDREARRRSHSSRSTFPLRHVTVQNPHTIHA